MKIINQILAIILFLYVIVGCDGNKRSSIESGYITVEVTAKYPKKELILQDFLDVEYIPLETNDEFVTSANIHTIGREVMIFTNFRAQGAGPWGDGDIFIFDRTGKGLRKINRFGQGTEEYTNTQQIIPDKYNDEIIVNNTYLSKVLVYDLFGNFKRSFKQREGYFYLQMGDFDRDNLICHDGYFDSYNDPKTADLMRNYFLIVSKQDGIIKEIQIPFKEKKSMQIYGTDGKSSISIRNAQLIPFKDSWILTEPSADTIYSYSQDHTMTPFIVRTPSIQSMNPEIFLFPGILTDRYYFMQTVKKEFNFVTNTGLQRIDLMYDRQENAIFEYVLYNDDFTNKKPMSLVYEVPMFAFGNDEIAFIKRLEAHELVEAYENGELKGKLKEIVAELNEESNAVIMLAKYKK